MNKINQEQFEDILYNPNKVISEKSSYSGLEYVTAVYEGFELVAERIITSKGTEYYAK